MYQRRGKKYKALKFAGWQSFLARRFRVCDWLGALTARKIGWLKFETDLES